MFGPLGLPELIFIFVLALLIFGPKRLPEMGRTIGRALGEFRRATSDLKSTFDTELALDDEPKPTYRRSPAPRPSEPARDAEGSQETEAARDEAPSEPAEPADAPPSDPRSETSDG